MHTTTESKSVNTLFHFLRKPVEITVRSSCIILHRRGIWGLSLTHLLKTLLLTFAYAVMMTYTSVWPSRGIHTPQHWNSDSWTYPLTRNETRGKIFLCLSQLLTTRGGEVGGELCLTHKGGWSSVSLHCNPQLPESLQIPPHTTLQTIPSPKLLKYFLIWNGQQLIPFSIGKQWNNYRKKFKFC